MFLQKKNKNDKDVRDSIKGIILKRKEEEDQTLSKIQNIGVVVA